MCCYYVDYLQPPDNAEIESYLALLNKRIPAIHIGRTGDEHNDAGRLLQKYASTYEFVSSVDVRKLIRHF